MAKNADTLAIVLLYTVRAGSGTEGGAAMAVDERVDENSGRLLVGKGIAIPRA